MQQDALIVLMKALKGAKAYTDEMTKVIAGGLKYKGSVASKEALPLSGNKLGFMYTTNDTGHEWVWTKDAATGTLEDWLDLNKDLENYYKKTEVDALLLSLKNELIANINTKQDIISDLDDIRDGASKGKTAIQEHQDISGKLNKLPNVDDPSDPGYGYPYWIPYSFATTTKADGLDITLKTLTLDNNLLKHEFTNPFPVVSTTQAGIMTAQDKVDLDGKQDKLTAGDNITIDANNVISGASQYTVTLDV